MAAMNKKPRMTLDDVANDMRAHGMAIEKGILSQCLKEKIFPFAHIVSVGETGRTTFLIMRKDYEEWARDYLYAFCDNGTGV